MRTFSAQLPLKSFRGRPNRLTQESSKPLSSSQIQVNTQESVAWGILILVLFLLLSPIYVLFIGAILCLYRPIHWLPVTIGFTMSFTAVHLSRELGVMWSLVANDDVPNYITAYLAYGRMGFRDIVFATFGRGAIADIGMEPLYGLFFYIIYLLTGGSIAAMLVVQYAIFGLLGSVVAFLISRKHMLLLLFFQHVIFLEIWYNTAHLFRHQLASQILMIGVVLVLLHNRKIGYFVAFLSIGFHFASALPFGLLIAFGLLQKRIFVKDSNSFINSISGIFGRDFTMRIFQISLIIAAAFAIPLSARFLAELLAMVGYTRALGYLMGAGNQGLIAVVALIGLTRAIVTGIICAAFITYCTNNRVAYYSLGFVFICLALGFAGTGFGVWGRLMLFATPILALGLGIAALNRFKPNIIVVLISALFVLRVARRTVFAGANEMNVFQHIANGDLFLPFSGSILLWIRGFEMFKYF